MGVALGGAHVRAYACMQHLFVSIVSELLTKPVLYTLNCAPRTACVWPRGAALPHPISEKRGTVIYLETIFLFCRMIFKRLHCSRTRPTDQSVRDSTL